MAKVLIYTLPLCGYCVMAKRLLKSRGATYEEVNVSGDTTLRDWLLETTGQRTLPQIFIDDISFGGYNELSVLDRQGALLKLLHKDYHERDATSERAEIDEGVLNGDERGGDTESD